MWTWLVQALAVAAWHLLSAAPATSTLIKYLHAGIADQHRLLPSLAFDNVLLQTMRLATGATARIRFFEEGATKVAFLFYLTL